MPIIGVGLSTIIAIFFAVHVIKTGQDRYWLFILFIFPFLGSLVYFFAIFLSSIRQTHSGYKIESKIRQTLNPHKELKDAQYAYDLSPTVDARLRLANALVNKGLAKDAIPHYQAALVGVYKDAPDILLQYAHALFLTDNYTEVKKTLDLLRIKNPNYRSEKGHILYARTLVKLNDIIAAKKEFAALLSYASSLEANVRYIEALVQWNEKTEAKQRLDELQHRIRLLPKHARRMNAEWIAQAQKLAKEIR